MTGYLVNFAVYTMAMLGLIFFALMVYKKFTVGGISKTSKTRMLSIEETISIAPRKTLYVVRAGNEKFLIAGDIDKTTLISKLDTDKTPESEPIVENTDSAIIRKKIEQTLEQKIKPVKETVQNKPLTTKEEISRKNSVDDLPIIVDFQQKAKQQPNVLHNMIKKING